MNEIQSIKNLTGNFWLFMYALTSKLNERRVASRTGFPSETGGLAMRKQMIGLLATALIPGLLTLAGVGHAAEINEHTIKFATAGAIGSPIALGMDRFAEIVKEKSGGQITVKRFPGCLLYTSPSPRDISGSRMPSSA